MKFGIAVTTHVALATTEKPQLNYLRELSFAAENNNYDSIWVSNRTAFPDNLADVYLERFGPGKGNPKTQNVLEPLTALSYVAGLTHKIQLATSVLMLPFRNIVLNTKMLATLDDLSQGCPILEVGSGWMQEEFTYMGSNSPDRAQIIDHHLEFFIQACSNPVMSYKGTHISTVGMKLHRQSKRKSHPPIWVSGNSPAAPKRAAILGHGWHGIMLSPSELAKSIENLDKMGLTQNKDLSEIDISMRATVSVGTTPRDEIGNSVLLIYDIEAIRTNLYQYQEAGLNYNVISIAGNSIDEVIESTIKFGDAILN